MTVEQRKQTPRHDTLAALQRRISEVERGCSGGAREGDIPAPLKLGAGPVDDALRGGLPRAALHDILPADHGATPAATGFGLALLARLAAAPGGRAGPVLWCLPREEIREFGRPYGPGLASLGVAPERLILVTVRNDRQVLQALEEGLRAGVLAAVMGWTEKADLTASRRLSLAAEEGRTPCLLFRPYTAVSTSAARTRWRVASAPGGPDALDPRAPGLPRWQVTLERCRNGRPGAWALEWDHETLRFHLAAPLADRPAAPRGAPGEVVPLRRTG